MAVSVKLKQLEEALRDRGFGRSLRLIDKRSHAPLPTGCRDFDLQQEGLRRGAISEVLGPPFSGRTELVFSALARATGSGEVAAYIDATDCLDPKSAEQAGIVLDRLLWVRCLSRELPRYARIRGEDPDQAWRALNLVAAAGGFGLIVADLGGLSLRQLAEWQRRPWVRLRQVIEPTATVLAVLTERHVVPGAMSIDLSSLQRPVGEGCAA